MKNYSHVWRKVGTRHETENIVFTLKSSNAYLCIWGMFAIFGRCNLVRISGTLNQFKYIDILRQYILPLTSAHQAANFRFIYQHDGCGPHHAKRVLELWHSNGANVLTWSAQSPDLSPIENVWGIMKRRLRIQLHILILLMNSTNNSA